MAALGLNTLVVADHEVYLQASRGIFFAISAYSEDSYNIRIRNRRTYAAVL